MQIVSGDWQGHKDSCLVDQGYYKANFERWKVYRGWDNTSRQQNWNILSNSEIQLERLRYLYIIKTTITFFWCSGVFLHLDFSHFQLKGSIEQCTNSNGKENNVVKKNSMQKQCRGCSPSKRNNISTYYIISKIPIKICRQFYTNKLVISLQKWSKYYFTSNSDFCIITLL